MRISRILLPDAGHPHFATEGAVPEPRTVAGDARFRREFKGLGLRVLG